MRTAPLILCAIALAACANQPVTPSRAGACGVTPPEGMEYSWVQACSTPAVASSPPPTPAADDNRPWCEKNKTACIALLPVIIPLAITAAFVDHVQQNGLGIAADTLANTNTYSDRVKTPSGTYDVNSVCTYGNCNTTVKKR